VAIGCARFPGAELFTVAPNGHCGECGVISRGQFLLVLEMILFVLLPVYAEAMARGYGQLLPLLIGPDYPGHLNSHSVKKKNA
jgi:hypothetical protein